ncbi:hypothetical protein CEXT_19741 [Caerostris extrusa]|uniref:Uncharacterized protein n=1 Tax=Caerostris extrusa TaxID=172846 RepID=A0AAV4TQZ8_CAEEX|nr:hypothetical protein CEXT_19741 [Caerostris extrusa]
MDPLIVRQRILMEDPVVSLCYVTSYDVNLACFIPAFPDVVHPMICQKCSHSMEHPVILQNVLLVWSILCMKHPDITKCSISMEHLVYGASCGMPKCSCDVKYPMVYSMVWILLSYAKRIPMEEPVVSLCYVTSYDVTLYGASCGMPKCSCDVKYPMVYSWYGSSYRTPKDSYGGSCGVPMLCNIL